MTSPESDEFGFLDISEEDFARIDDEVASLLLEQEQINQLKTWAEGADEPKVEISLENEDVSALETVRRRRPSLLIPTETSPYMRYRSRRGVLSVTDLTALNWCELQFDYGLRQLRHLNLKYRPNKFMTAAGKEITVEKAVAARNDITLTRGKAVHKALEEEIRPDVVEVTVTTDEEKWGLRLLTMIACLNDLKEPHSLDKRMLCREMPVFGIVHGQPVVGVIDEIERCSINLQHTSPSKKRAITPVGDAARTPSPKKARTGEPAKHNTDADIAAFFVPSPAQVKDSSVLDIHSSSKHTPSRTNTLRLFDSKTRRKPTLPADEDVVSSRMQLMLYHQLLTALITDFDFSTFWAIVGVEDTRVFSDTFRAEALALLTSDGMKGVRLQCLTDLALLWRRQVDELTISGVDKVLTLVYRRQVNVVHPKRPSCHHSDHAVGVPSQGQQESEGKQSFSVRVVATENMAAASVVPDATVAPPVSSVNALDETQSSNITSIERSIVALLGEEAELAWAIEQSLLPNGASESQIEPNICSQSQLQSLKRGDFSGQDRNDHPDSPLYSRNSNAKDIIGKKEFVMDELELEARVKHSLSYWYGYHLPEGVPVGLVRRCSTCEYREGCEWREQKAEEALRRYWEKQGFT